MKILLYEEIIQSEKKHATILLLQNTKRQNTKTYISENNITTFKQLLQKIAKKNHLPHTKIHDINLKKTAITPT